MQQKEEENKNFGQDFSQHEENFKKIQVGESYLSYLAKIRQQQNDLQMISSTPSTDEQIEGKNLSSIAQQREFQDIFQNSVNNIQTKPAWKPPGTSNNPYGVSIYNSSSNQYVDSYSPQLQCIDFLRSPSPLKYSSNSRKPSNKSKYSNPQSYQDRSNILQFRPGNEILQKEKMVNEQSINQQHLPYLKNQVSYRNNQRQNSLKRNNLSSPVVYQSTNSLQENGFEDVSIQLLQKPYESQIQFIPRRGPSEIKKIMFRKRVKIALISLRFLIRYWRSIRVAILKQRREIIQKYSPEYLKTVIDSVMEFVSICSHDQLIQLFQEHRILTYSKDSKGELSKSSKINKQRLRKHVLDILEVLSKQGSHLLTASTCFIDFLLNHLIQGQYFFDGLFPPFILDRLEFNSFGKLQNITESQSEMIVLFFFFVYGLLNRLVDPWNSLSIQETPVRAGNAQLVLSVIFYLLKDYLCQYCPKRMQKFSKEKSKYFPKPRENPLNSYSKIMMSDPMYQNKKGESDLIKIRNELHNQTYLNDNIMIGLYPRKNLEDLSTQDESLILQSHKCFSLISIFLMEKVQLINEYKQNLISQNLDQQN